MPYQITFAYQNITCDVILKMQRKTATHICFFSYNVCEKSRLTWVVLRDWPSFSSSKSLASTQSKTVILWHNLVTSPQVHWYRFTFCFLFSLRMTELILLLCLTLNVTLQILYSVNGPVIGQFTEQLSWPV